MGIKPVFAYKKKLFNMNDFFKVDPNIQKISVQKFKKWIKNFIFQNRKKWSYVDCIW